MMTEKLFEQLRNEQREKELQKQQFRHDWKITVFNVFGGAVAGLITSIIFWLATK